MRTPFLAIAFLFSQISFSQPYNQVDANGLKQGTWKKAYDNNTVYQWVGQFKDDKPYGKFVYYYESGDVKAVIQFSADGSYGYSKMYHESGYMMARGKYVNEAKDSTWVYFDDRGIVSYQENYKNGKLDGDYIVYYEPVDGKYLVAKYYTYKDGVRHGAFKTYHPNTKLESEGNYNNGLLNGTVIRYHSNGKIKVIERWVNGVKEGTWEFFDETGVKVGTKIYVKGVAQKQ